MYKDVMSMVKMILFSPEKLRNISLAFCEKTCLTGPLQYKYRVIFVLVLGVICTLRSEVG